MYGIVNKAIQGLVIDQFGEDKWKEVAQLCNVEGDLFISNLPYPDQLTYDLAVAASKVLSINLNDVLIAFGEYWVIETGSKQYGSLMQAGGDNFKQFLINLPNFHSRVMLIYPNLTPPEFMVQELKSNTLLVHYISQRDGLTYFMYGLISGLAKLYSTKVEITIIDEKLKGAKHDVFSVQWS